MYVGYALGDYMVEIRRYYFIPFFYLIDTCGMGAESFGFCQLQTRGAHWAFHLYPNLKSDCIIIFSACESPFSFNGTDSQQSF